MFLETIVLALNEFLDNLILIFNDILFLLSLIIMLIIINAWWSMIYINILGRTTRTRLYQVGRAKRVLEGQFAGTRSRWKPKTRSRDNVQKDAREISRGWLGIGWAERKLGDNFMDMLQLNHFNGVTKVNHRFLIHHKYTYKFTSIYLIST